MIAGVDEEYEKERQPAKESHEEKKNQETSRDLKF